MIYKIALLYFCFISILSILLTVYDKIASKMRWRRIKENFLMFLGIMGGSFAMYAMMRIIRHKTRHTKFMKGLPTILTVQFILFGVIVFILI